MKRYLIVGASRGIGASVAAHLKSQGHQLISVARTQPLHGQWIQADVSNSAGIDKIVESLGDQPLDGLLYMGGVWERGAFTSDFDFLRSPDPETRLVIDVNLIAPIEITKRLHRNLKTAENPRAIFVGASSGLDHCATSEVANTASKFGLRGAVQALRQAFQGAGIGFTIINPGNLATDEVLSDIQEGRFPEQAPIPMCDFCSLIDCILTLSPTTDVSEVNLVQKET